MELNRLPILLEENNMDINEAKKQLMELQSKMSAYMHAMELIYYDEATSAPKKTAKNR